MVGLIGTAKDDGLPSVTIQENEMEDVRWFHIDEVKKALQSKGENGSFNFPGKSSLGRYLINKWCEEHV
jgi:NADH pyrophosphatase NudC (nudix superfamily)